MEKWKRTRLFFAVVALILAPVIEWTFIVPVFHIWVPIWPLVALSLLPLRPSTRAAVLLIGGAWYDSALGAVGAPVLLGSVFALTVLEVLRSLLTFQRLIVDTVLAFVTTGAFLAGVEISALLINRVQPGVLVFNLSVASALGAMIVITITALVFRRQITGPKTLLDFAVCIHFGNHQYLCP